MASSIAVTAAQTGFSDANKTLTFPTDQDFTDMIAAYQSDANASVNGTASRNQVLNYIFNTLLRDPIKARIAQHKTVITPGAQPNIT